MPFPSALVTKVNVTASTEFKSNYPSSWAIDYSPFCNIYPTNAISPDFHYYIVINIGDVLTNYIPLCTNSNLHNADPPCHVNGDKPFPFSSCSLDKRVSSAQTVYFPELWNKPPSGCFAGYYNLGQSIAILHVIIMCTSYFYSLTKISVSTHYLEMPLSTVLGQLNILRHNLNPAHSFKFQSR